MPLALALVTLALALRLAWLDHQRRKRMAGFDASTVVEPLEYNFATKDNPKGKKGTVREPSDQQIADYMTGIKQIVKTVKAKLPDTSIDPETSDISELFDSVDDLDPETVMAFHRDLAGVIAALCSGDPSKDDLLAVPIRIRVMFYGWLQREVMSPEAAPGAGNVVTMPRAAAG